MLTRALWLGCLGVSVAAVTVATFDAAAADEVVGPGSTRVAKWKDDKQGALLLTFDDSLPSQIDNAVPELKKRGLVGTFYVNPGGGQWKARQDVWEKTFPQEFPTTGMEYGNHTITHHGAKDQADFDDEIAKCNDVILRLFPGKQPRLISYALPGVKKEQWSITPEEHKAVLAKYHLAQRPAYAIAGVGAYTSADRLMALADDAIAKADVRCIVFHGVGGNHLSVAMPVFAEFLDKLVAKRDQLWITTGVPEHKYATERDSATAKVLQADAQEIRLELTTQADPQFYDHPLTLVTQVPAGWTQCEIVQGTSKVTGQAAGGAVRYHALPNGQPITIRNGAK
ncbi:MAG: hypothetical protein A3K19_05000 [Lentisphaerae bacterium RIFOXYB12_FULL_65_16]|nr:MAG: hypothetical protein A3K18_35350 [Lentisphaerae bacterium RIFOXYA12_64_32]OGV89749.1 MAG: hypothetical protein A3K19_05000 [Lentisphaerae bacterium RIFOXYB12_FULL_65_16]